MSNRQPPKKLIRQRRPGEQFTYRFTINKVEYTGETKTTNQKAALKIAQDDWWEKIRQVDRQIKLKIGPMNWGRACYTWFKEVGVKSKETDKKTQVRWLRDALGIETQCHDISRSDVTKLRQKRERMRSKSGELIKPSQVNKYLRLLQQILNYMRDHHDVDVAPFSISKFFLEERKTPLPKISVGDQSELCAVADPDVEAVIEFNTLSGFRISQVFALRKADCDTDNREYLHIQEKRSGKNREMSEAERMMILARWDDHPEYVFTRVAKRTRDYRRGKIVRSYVEGKRYPFVYDGFVGKWNRLFKEAEVKRKNIHAMRHTAATRVLAVSELATARDTLGHENSKTTEIYTEVMSGAVAKAKDAAYAAMKKERKRLKREHAEALQKRAAKTIQPKGVGARLGARVGARSKRLAAQG
jgi:integrase